VQGYLSKLNQMSGKQYRLPTEQEWKHACDGGSSQDFCGSNSLDAVGWYDGNSGGKTHPVGQKQANGYGLYDMTGNVWEWMQDCWEGDCLRRVLRGSSWSISSERAGAANRNRFTAAFRSSFDDHSRGFRVVVRSASQRRAQ
jgi:formylglycine-generating enzyme required for sulfatase activity